MTALSFNGGVMSLGKLPGTNIDVYETSDQDFRRVKMKRTPPDQKSGISFFTILPIVIFSALCLTNPSKQEFVLYASQKISGNISQNLNSDNQFLNNIVSGFAGLVVDGLIQHQNFLVFSTYSLDLELVRRFGGNVKDVKFLGIAGRFIPLSMPDFDDTKSLYETKSPQSSSVRNIQDSILRPDCSIRTPCEKEEVIEMDNDKK